MTKPVEKIYDMTTRHKLTVTPERVTMRFAKDSLETEQSRVQTFFTEVAGALGSVGATVRGNLAVHLESDTLYIVMKNEKNTISTRFFESDFQALAR